MSAMSLQTQGNLRFTWRYFIHNLVNNMINLGNLWLSLRSESGLVFTGMVRFCGILET